MTDALRDISFLTESGMSATRASPGRVSLSTAIFISLSSTQLYGFDFGDCGADRFQNDHGRIVVLVTRWVQRSFRESGRADSKMVVQVKYNTSRKRVPRFGSDAV